LLTFASSNSISLLCPEVNRQSIFTLSIYSFS
jgi:hypothetical protein